ncbi:terpene synthase family protein [Streptomyces niveus]|uniref:Terpene synthase n=1 Tax=Streptomyces niveus TaxID=193462 RepID=A0ABZ1ZY29_STRNV|nr:hypothetical protein [Streptomyces niveus]
MTVPAHVPFDFYCPFPPEENPGKAALAENSIRWTQKFAFGHSPEKLLAYGGGGALLTTHLFPWARGEAAQVLSDYSAWAFLINDSVIPPDADRPLGDVVEEIARCVQVCWTAGALPDCTTPLVVAAGEVFDRMKRVLTPIQFVRFTRTQTEWLQTMLWELAMRERGHHPGVNEYIAMRIGAVGCFATLGYIDGLAMTKLPETELSTPKVRAACLAALFAAALDNDRYSLTKEAGRPKYNIFSALRTDDPNLTEAQSITEGIALRDRILHLYTRLRAEILPTASLDLRRYLHCVENVVSGNLYFGTHALRYYAPGGGPQVTVSEHAPPGTCLTAPPYPAISWWWDQLRATAGRGSIR